jgi:sugar lactone lactonase YvrE
MKTSKVLSLLFLLFFLSYACNDNDFFTPDAIDKQLDIRAAYPDIIDLPDGFQPEGIVVGTGHTAYVGSIFSGEIWKFDLATGAGAILVEATYLPIVGLSYDHRSKLLFAARGYTGLVSVYNSTTGIKVNDYIVTAPGPLPTTWINDLIVTKKAVYVTDSFRPFIYKIPLGPHGRLPDQSEVEEIPLTGDFDFTTEPGPTGFFFNSNGIEATPNGKHLILAHSDFGLIYKVDPNSGEATLVDLGGDSIPSVDGILLDPGHDGYILYAVQNLPNRLTVVHLNTDLLSGSIIDVITDVNFKIPTTLDEFGGDLYLVNARFDIASPFMPAPGIPFDVIKMSK